MPVSAKNVGSQRKILPFLSRRSPLSWPGLLRIVARTGSRRDHPGGSFEVRNRPLGSPRGGVGRLGGAAGALAQGPAAGWRVRDLGADPEALEMARSGSSASFRPADLDPQEKPRRPSGEETAGVPLPGSARVRGLADPSSRGPQRASGLGLGRPADGDGDVAEVPQERVEARGAGQDKLHAGKEANAYFIAATSINVNNS